MITVRKAQPADIQLIHDMADVVFRHTYRDILSQQQMEYMMEWMYSLENLAQQFKDGHHYYLAFDGVEPVGYLSVQRQEIDSTGVEIYHLHKIYVMPDIQGKGIGRKLFETAVGHVKNDNPGVPARIELNVNRYNGSIEFYRHLGMKILTEGDFPIGNGFYMNDYIMGLEIER